jgi:peptidyl-prolyl cis-trans isomerase SurA
MPFANSYGYNIIKLLEVIPVAPKEDDVVTQATLQQLVEGGDRLALARGNLLKQWLIATKYKRGAYNEADLWAYTDSASTRRMRAFKGLDSLTVLFSFPNKKITAGDWIRYVQSVNQSGGAAAQRKYPLLLSDYINQTCGEYYRAHIEEFNSAISEQMKEFNEANLLFAITDKYVWGKASLDSAALLQYYSKHQQNYKWAPGVSALTVTANSKQTIDSIAKKVKAAPAAWHSIAFAYNNLITAADSSRYESGQLPVKQFVPMEAGFASVPEKNETGDAWTFVYVFDVYPQQSQRSFDDAKGMVINDYQNVLESEWLATLKKKYPVKINEQVLNGLK